MPENQTESASNTISAPGLRTPVEQQASMGSGSSTTSSGAAASSGSSASPSSGSTIVNGGTATSGAGASSGAEGSGSSGSTQSPTASSGATVVNGGTATSGSTGTTSSGASNSSQPGVAPASNGYGGGTIPSSLPSSGGSTVSSGSSSSPGGSGGTGSGGTTTSSGSSTSSQGTSSSNPYGASPSGVIPQPSSAAPVSSGATITFGGNVVQVDNTEDANANVTPPQVGDTKLLSIAGRDNTMDKQPLPWSPKFILHTTTGTLINQAFIVRIDALPSGGSQVTLIDESTYNFHLAPKDLAKQFSGFSPVDVSSGGTQDSFNKDGSYVFDMGSASITSSGS